MSSLVTPSLEFRERYLQEGLSYFPKLLELVDKNRLSETYGCFDRAFWHYRTSDFPSGMYQEAVLPLALAFGLEAPHNPYFHEERIKELAVAGIDFARKSAHADGACDDYFPFERASGATAFSLYACTEAYQLLHLNHPDFLAFFKKTGHYLAGYGYEESGILSNHKALIILSLFNVFLVTGDPFFKKQAQEKLEHLLSLQDSEGWFPEYEGADPGYLTFTIDFLAKYFRKSKDEKVIQPLVRAIEFASSFMHPDGSFGGEYGSRNTFHFVPHGFEVMAAFTPKAALTVNQFLDSMKTGKRSYIDDDRIFIHYVYNYLQAYEDFYSNRQVGALFKDQTYQKHFPHASLLVQNSKAGYAVFSLAKGGVGKIFKEKRLALSDCGLVGKTEQGVKFISQVIAPREVKLTENELVVEGDCYEHRDILFTPFLFVAFRLFMILVARFLPANAVRSLLQKKAILKRKKSFPLKYKKCIPLDTLDYVDYTFYLKDPGVRLKELWIGSDPTFIYIATSQPYQPGNLKSWMDLSSILPTLHEKGTAAYRYTLS